MTHIGFTGTQKGMNQKQLVKLLRFLREEAPLVDSDLTFHHGDCVGADAQFHSLVRKYSSSSKVHVHPPENQSKRAFCKGDFFSPPKPYLVRNHDIVDCSLMLIAAPCTNKPSLRSGTWATIRYANKARARGLALILFLYPEGV